MECGKVLEEHVRGQNGTVAVCEMLAPVRVGGLGFTIMPATQAYLFEVTLQEAEDSVEVTTQQVWTAGGRPSGCTH